MSADLEIDLNSTDTIKLYGVTYSLALFRAIAKDPPNSVLRIINRADGTVDSERLHWVERILEQPTPPRTPLERARWLLRTQFIRGDGMNDLQATILHEVMTALEARGGT